ncbi:MAG TPA: FG-GAP-like repeat-containing protein, partial [Thermoanaerobaculia bacterium]|nr:FG-GAP-like repeat-containing protein [Thermoanaerobaculia bacterium]
MLRAGLPLAALAIGAALAAGCRDGEGDRAGGAGLPAPGSDAYEQTVRRFYRGLAQLEVGMIDAAIEELSQATVLAPGEPASWADLGLAHLRLGAYEPAASAIGQAATLAPDDSRVAFLQAQLATAQGNREEGIAHLRRAVELDPGNLPARTALVEAVEDSGAPGADDEAQRLLEEIVERAPENVAALVERARLAAKRNDGALLADSLARLAPFAEAWPPEVVEQLRAVEEAAAAGDFAGAARALAFLRNVLVRVPSYLESRARISSPGELIAEPVVRFLALPAPSSTPSPADLALAYTTQPVGDAPAAWTTLVAFSPDGEAPPALFAADAAELRRVDAAGAAFPFPGGADAAGPPPYGLAAVDWNADFRLDLAAAGPAGVRLFLQGEDGGFAAAEGGRFSAAATGAWPADVEMDGDLDLVVGVRGAEPTVLRNNGDGTWEPIEPFDGPTGVAAFVWGDLDGDADPDAATVDGAGGLHVFANLQAGRFARLDPPPTAAGIAGLALGDADADGRLDLVTLAGGAVRRAALAADGSWEETAWTTWSGAPAEIASGAARLLLADLDNNGALDLVASAPGATAVWLADEERALQPLPAAVDVQVFAAADLDGDGQLDLAGLAEGRPVRLIGQGTLGYHHHLVRPRAVETAGDQRINSFGIGGLVEVRAGLLVQEQPIAGPAVHFGLGAREAVDVTRIVWPNGVAQAEFDPAVDQAVVAEQRLKGSCPWVFADGGDGLAFVTDFLWRSPLGLKINATDTAGVTQTEDWIRIPGDRLAARDGAYHLAITAELWETHFFDHVSLLVVDHPADVEVFVDERFVPTAPPALAVHATAAPRPVAGAW